MKRSTLILATALALVSVYIFYYELDPVEEQTGTRVFNIEAESVAKIVIDSRQRERLELRRIDSVPAQWHISHPVAAPADTKEIDSLLENMVSLTNRRVVAQVSGDDLEQYGLLTPALTLEFHTTDGSRNALALGVETPTGDSRYARELSGEDVFTVAADRLNNFDRTDWELRDKRVFRLEDPSPENLVSLSIDTAAHEASRASDYSLSRKAGGWELSRDGHSLLADRGAASALTSEWLEADMTGVLLETASPSQRKEYGLATASRMIRLTMVGAAPITLEIGAEQDSGFAAAIAGEPVIFTLKPSLVSNEQERLPDSLVSKKLTELSVLEIHRIDITLNGDAQLASKEQGADATEWRLLQPEPRALATKSVEDFLYRLNGVRVDSLLARKPDGNLLAFFTLTGREENRAQTISFFEGDGQVLAVRNEEPYALVLATELWEELRALARFSMSEPEAIPSEG